MELDGSDIRMSKVLSAYDELALKFSARLRKVGVKHVFVSGYVALLFGRSRMSEDIDLLVERMPFAKFQNLWKALGEGFYCHNAPDAKSAYYDYLEEKLAIRFSEHDVVLPNVEFKWASTAQHRRVLADALTVHLPEGTLAISTIEAQVAYKLYLGSDKDFGDARHLFELFKDKLDMKKLRAECADLDVGAERRKKVLGL